MSISRSPLALALVVLVFLSISNLVAGNTYTLADDYLRDTSALFIDFTFFTAKDPTAGFVKYVDLDTAVSTSLVAVLEGPSSSPFSNGTQAVYVSVDSTSVTPAGRPSVRLTSNKSYNPGMLLIADIAHMPTGCGVWPAFWAVGPNWPKQGEIDIIEGVNLQTTNSMTLHTSAGCTVANSSTAFSGTLLTANCDIDAADQGGNQGCQVMDAAPSTSFGAGFNAAGGGVFVTEWTAAVINIWFFTAAAPLPASLTAANPSTAALGLPAASFTDATCDFASHFSDLQIVLDTTLCGDWAGADAVWSVQGCAAETGVATCQDFVANHPESFQEAFWGIRGLAVYEAVGAAKGKRVDGEGEGREWRA